MPLPLPSSFRTRLAWRFDHLLPGSFRRKKADFAHHDYPIVGPLPSAGRRTAPLEASTSSGPFIYFVCDDQRHVRYVGKSLEEQVIHRWVRPGIGGPASHYWTHSTRSGGAIFEIARGLREGDSSFYDLRYLVTTDLPSDLLLPDATQSRGDALPQDELRAITAVAETALIRRLAPDWNSR